MENSEQLEEMNEVEALEYELSERRFSAFVQYAWEVLEPGKPLLWNWHLELVCETLQNLYLRHLAGESCRLIINVPPRNLKSTIVTVCFPAWVWIQENEIEGKKILGASKRFLSTSYAQSLSTKHAVDSRTLIQSDWFQRGWGHRFQLSDEQDTKTEYLNNQRGHRIATSMHGTATGKGGDFLTVDDPHDTTIAESEVQRKATIEAFDQKFTSRLDNKKTGAIVIVMQRLHQEDLTGHCLKQGGWEHLCLPAEWEEEDGITHVFPLSHEVVQRTQGDLLHPEREGPPELAAMKKALGSQGYAGQYQQRPTAREGGIIKRAWCQNFYKVLPDRISERVQSWDATFKDSQTSDYVAGHAWIRSEGKFYLVDRFHDRADIVATMTAIKSFSAKHPKFILKLIEDKANGPALIQMLKSKVPGLVPVTPEGSKDARMSAVAPLWEAGNVYLPDPSIAPWIHDFIEEIVNFPNASNDDDCDAMTQALLRLMKAVSTSFTKELIPNKIKSLSSSYRGADQW